MLTGVARAASLAVAAAVLAGCAASGTMEDGRRQPSPPLPTSTAELREGFEEQSGLRIPPDATEMEIEAELLEDHRPYYQLRFVTTRGGAEVVCTADNFSVYALEQPPSDRLKEVFPVREQDSEIAAHAECEGSHPTKGRVRRGVLVLFPEDGLKNDDGEPDGGDTAVVYAYSSVDPA